MIKSIIDIEMNDSAFQRFSQLFDQYQQKLAATKPAWNSVRADIQVSAQAFDRMSAALLANTELQRKLAQEQKAAQTHTQASTKSWHDIYRTTSNVAIRMKQITGEFLRWSGAVAAFGGLMGAGGLFGIERLAGAATNIRQQALGFGVTPGEQRAWNVDYGQFFNVQQSEQGIYAAMHDITKRRELMGFGVSQAALNSNDPFRVMTELMKLLPEKTKGWSPETFINMMQAYGLDQIFQPQQIQAWNKASPQERQYWLQHAQQDTKLLSMQDQQLSAWQKLYAQLQRAGAEIETVFIKGLTPLAPQISLLSENFTKLVAAFMASPTVKQWIDDIAQALGKFAQFIGTPQFAADVQNLTAQVGKISGDLFQFGETILGWVKWANTQFGPGTGTTGSIFGTPYSNLLPGFGPGAQQAWQNPSGAGGPSGDVMAMQPGALSKGLQWDKQKFDQFWNWFTGGGSANIGGYFKNQAWMGGADVSGMLHNIGFSSGSNNLREDLVYSTMMQESGGNPYALSKTGAMGLMQLEPGTAKAMGVTNPWDPIQNLRGGTKYLMQQMDTFHGDIAEALAAYNAGPGAVESAMQKAGPGGDWLSLMKPETQNYVPSILRRMLSLQIAQGGGLTGGRITIQNSTGGSAVVSSSQLYAM